MKQKVTEVFYLVKNLPSASRLLNKISTNTRKMPNGIMDGFYPEGNQTVNLGQHPTHDASFDSAILKDGSKINFGCTSFRLQVRKVHKEESQSFFSCT